MIGKISAISIAILAVCSIANAEQVRGVDGLAPGVVAETERLFPQFEELNSILSAKLDKKPELKNNPKRIIGLAQKELGFKCIGACLSRDKLLRKAIKLFVALDTTVGKCDTESFEILAKNTIVLWPSAWRFTVVQQVLDHYRKLHAEDCWAKHMVKFRHLSESVSKAIADKLKRAFSTLNIVDFGYYGESKELKAIFNFDLVGMLTTSFFVGGDASASRKVASALRKVAGQLKKERGLSQEKPGKMMDVAELKPIIEESLLEPCRVFRRHLGPLLDAARLDAAIENEYQKSFIHGDEKFYYALISNRLCASLLKEGTRLYDPMTIAWNNALF